jgi:hypothetical protein
MSLYIGVVDSLTYNSVSYLENGGRLYVRIPFLHGQESSTTVQKINLPFATLTKDMLELAQNHSRGITLAQKKLVVSTKDEITSNTHNHSVTTGEGTYTTSSPQSDTHKHSLEIYVNNLEQPGHFLKVGDKVLVAYLDNNSEKVYVLARL